MLQAEHVCSACKDACIIVITGIINAFVVLFVFVLEIRFVKDWNMGQHFV